MPSVVRNFSAELKKSWLEPGQAIEAYEISEYARPLETDEAEKLFPAAYLQLASVSRA